MGPVTRLTASALRTSSMWLARVVFVCALPANSNPTAIPLDLSTISEPESPASLKGLVVHAVDHDLAMEQQLAERGIVGDLDVCVDTRDLTDAVSGRPAHLVDGHVDGGGLRSFGNPIRMMFPLARFSASSWAMAQSTLLGPGDVRVMNRVSFAISSVAGFPPSSSPGW